jgi:hypothetical protein
MTTRTSSLTTALHRRSIRLAAPFALAAAMVASIAAPALAATPVSRYTLTAYSNVGCNAANATMSVSASVTTMQGEGFLGGYVPTEYDAGQWMRYRVFAREIGQAAWTPVFTWSAWEWVQSMTFSGEVSINSPVSLGTSVVQGTPGHRYEARVQVDYWTGQENLYEAPASYSQTLSIGWYTYDVTPSFCTF